MFNVTTSSGCFGFEEDWACKRKSGDRSSKCHGQCSSQTGEKEKIFKTDILTVITVMCCDGGCCLDQKTTIGQDKIKINTWPTC